MFVTGTDEHGQKIQRTAEKNNLSPQEHRIVTVAEFYSLWEKFNIRFDRLRGRRQ
jgi:methionyl-tRNA synthetase